MPFCLNTKIHKSPNIYLHKIKMFPAHNGLALQTGIKFRSDEIEYYMVLSKSSWNRIAAANWTKKKKTKIITVLYLSWRNPINIDTWVNILTIACRIPFGILCNSNRPHSLHRLRNGFNLANENEKSVLKHQKIKENSFFCAWKPKQNTKNNFIIMNAIYVMAESSFEMRKRKSKREMARRKNTIIFGWLYVWAEAHVSVTSFI